MIDFRNMLRDKGKLENINIVIPLRYYLENTHRGLAVRLVTVTNMN